MDNLPKLYGSYDKQELADKIPFLPGYIDIPFDSISEIGKSVGEQSEVRLLLDALIHYKTHVGKSWAQEAKATQMALESLDTMINSTLDAVFERLSEASDILHRIKFNQLK